MNAQSVVLEAATIRPQCKALRMPSIAAWRQDYNHLRPHSSLGAMTPSEFAALKREQTTPPQEGEITGGLYL